ncbi:hypothetical protein Drorol1_Dr00022095 [Drosera rotundifolia]
MECHAIGFTRSPVRTTVTSRYSTICKPSKSTLSYNHIQLGQTATWKLPLCSRLLRLAAIPVDSLEHSSPLSSDDYNKDGEIKLSASSKESEEPLPQPVSSEVLKALLADKERAKLVKKLSEANQHNRFLKRQLQLREDALVQFKSELAVTELEIQALVAVAEEIANAATPEGYRMIHGRPIQSHLVSRLKAVQEKLMEQIKDVEAAQAKDVPLFWIGMAENVQVMGSFDGWSQGEHLSPEYTGSYTKFSTTLSLRPGRYEIKFLVDGDWRISPEFPTVGEGLMENNLLIVE